MMKTFNTMSLEKETFTPINEKTINMYVCGPTVYNYIHIGNARSAIAFDTIRRYFEYRGYEVNYVSNFTDVDDKMIAAASEQGITVPELADKYIDAFNEDTAPLNIKPATVRPRATEHIPEIIEFVEDLIKKGYAYESEGDVYFRAKKFKGYGILAHQDLAEMESNAAGRLDDGELARKEDPMDFAVWKGENGDGAIAWNSPWGKGRPGWHIECSVMSTKYLGNHLDIHGGGIDLAFPHHTNEIAQTEAHTGEKFVEKWLHNGFVTVGDENEKMSKSLGNFTTVHELLQQIDDPMVLRFFMATTQYRRPIAYSQKNMDLAARNLERIRTGYRNLQFRLGSAVAGSDADIEAKAQEKVDAFVEAMDDDFNAQNAMTAVYELIELANLYSQAEEVKTDTVNFVLKQIKDLMNVFGVDGLEQAPLLDADVDALIKERDAARETSNFARSDEIRDELASRGIILEDTPQGTRWRRA
ncbi:MULTISPECIES: cysteine--tRNA ligase [Weissella]|jgi:cysteinyl-tRNA synthetase|uniref:Cysteine--tRNA ligase n=1 Tax=Weissella cibaria TaxID=137591 RepID=A0A1X4JJX6_9LACO|nr:MULTISPECIES: cysteine--tRNA ligase [Weissella]AWF96435.1 Cysteine--tRNA ligase [Weissella cibaria]KXU10030.1 Cysteinyl-tRNA synthetase [Weissella sp. DD23]MBU7544192.1 cysteine--tRNA ligase [Weissella cibaria]MBZ5941603.1 cysteine--tRNA ligase [Weissella cibaria]MCA1354835.1 cysteine--tRNA ligase [Weissella cibaria]